MSQPTIDSPFAQLLYSRVYDEMARASGKERVRLRAFLRLEPEPCNLWQDDREGYLTCSTHSEMWHKRLPRPDVPCFASFDTYPSALATEPEGGAP